MEVDCLPWVNVANHKESIYMRHIVLPDETIIFFMRIIGSCTDEKFNLFLDHVRQFFKWIKKSSTNYYLVMSCKTENNITLTQMRDFARICEKKREIVRSYCRGTVILFDSLLLETIGKSVLLMVKPQRPVKVILDTQPNDGEDCTFQLGKTCFDGIMTWINNLPNDAAQNRG